MNILIPIIIGVVLAFIVVAILKSGLTTVQKQYSAADYVKRESFKLSRNEDRFLYKRLEKQPKETPQQQTAQKK